MKSIPKLIRRLIRILFLSFILIVIMNLMIFSIIAFKYSFNGSPWLNAQQTADAIKNNTQDSYCRELTENGIWCILIDNQTRQVIWKTDNLPEEVPFSYSIGDISEFSRGYIKNYPTFTAQSGDDLVVLGYPKTSYWKLLWPAWNYQLISHLPQIMLIVFIVNLLLIILIYIIANSKLIHSINPIVTKIQNLGNKQSDPLPENGPLSELATNLNRTATLLEEQNALLERKETARANWIAGVSHDIRTPLSMVMGYAAQLTDSTQIPENEKEKAAVIIKQSERIRNLVNDLNLSSKLEYNMQPLHLSECNLLAILRKVIVDFINIDLEQKYPIEWLPETGLTHCSILADKELCIRAFSNLIQNSINHNPDGCSIYITLSKSDHNWNIAFEDNGVGASKEEIEQISHAPHYMVCDDNISTQRHGLGLLIVKQITDSHHGTVQVSASRHGGFCVLLSLPIYVV